MSWCASSDCWKRRGALLWCLVSIYFVSVSTAVAEKVSRAKVENIVISNSSSRVSASEAASVVKATGNVKSIDRTLSLPRNQKAKGNGETGMIGFAAEWQYEEPPFPLESLASSTTSSSQDQFASSIPTTATTLESSKIFPSPRIGPGTWNNDHTGNWWLFGGIILTKNHYLNDLWRFSSSQSKWEQIFRSKPESSSSTNDENDNNSFPENLSSPLICGSKGNSGRLAVSGKVGRMNKKSIKTSSSSTSSTSPEEEPKTFPFSGSAENVVVWLYNLNSTATSTTTPEFPKDNGSSLQEGGQWRSHVCSDSTDKTNLEVCPEFEKETLSWCDHSGIMMLQPAASPVMSMPSKSNDYTTAPTTFAGATGDNIVEHFEVDAQQMSLWNFDMDTAKWTKTTIMTDDADPNTKTVQKLLHFGNCRVVSTNSEDELVYILCPSSKSSNLDRTVIQLDISKGTTSILGNIHLNNAFSNQNLWKSTGESILHAVFNPDRNLTIIFLAYHKLLDLWIHDHHRGKLYPVENVWKGDSLQVFENLDQLYRLSVAIEGSSKTHSFFMLNPRNKLIDFEKGYLGNARFWITIVPDKEVFLPRRDAASLDRPPTETVHNKPLPQKLEINSKHKSTPTPKTTATATVATDAFSDELLLKMEAHRKNKYRDGNRSKSSHSLPQKRILGFTRRSYSPNPSSSPTAPAATSPSPRNLPHEELLPTPQKRQVTFTPPTPSPELLQQKIHQNHHSVSNQHIDKLTIASSAALHGLLDLDSTSVMETPEAQGDIDDDHHIRSPGSMIYGGDSEGVDPRNANTIAMEHNRGGLTAASAAAAELEAVDPKIFFAVSLSLFGMFGVVLFVRRCVKCPPPPSSEEDPSVLVIHPQPPVRYSINSEDFSFHTPIV